MNTNALLIAAYQGNANKKICEEHLDELVLLADTYGLIVVDKVACHLRKVEASTFFGKGKIEELVLLAKELDVKIVVIDEDISPAQQRNLEEIFKLTVMDRSELILGVFAARAQTKEAKLQVDLAEAKYQVPRLKRLWTHLHRQTGSGSSGMFLKGEGEKQIEIDRRILKKKIEQLEKEIDSVEIYRKTQRQARKRSGIPVFAIVGYTNVGKSTLMNALTDAGVFVEDKLFATLDTTTRKFTLPNNQEILLIDTVGFIRKLPHLLVAAFRSTLEESMQADILLHLVDVSHPFAEEHAEASYGVLKELNVENKPVITVLNKIDQVVSPERLLHFRTKYPKNVAISATLREGFQELLDLMCKELQAIRRTTWLRIPQSEYALVAEIISKGILLHQEFEDNDIMIEAEIPSLLAERLKSFIIDK